MNGVTIMHVGAAGDPVFYLFVGFFLGCRVFWPARCLCAVFGASQNSAGAQFHQFQRVFGLCGSDDCKNGTRAGADLVVFIAR